VNPYIAVQRKKFEGKEIEQQIKKAMLLFREHTHTNISPQVVANELHLGYSWFRKMFKNYTGISPARYLQELKIQQVKNLLISTNKPIKEIAFELGYDSVFYFSRQFKNISGSTPSEFRTKQ